MSTTAKVSSDQNKTLPFSAFPIGNLFLRAILLVSKEPHCPGNLTRLPIFKLRFYLKSTEYWLHTCLFDKTWIHLFAPCVVFYLTLLQADDIRLRLQEFT
jgi:hypothetical protein